MPFVFSSFFGTWRRQAGGELHRLTYSSANIFAARETWSLGAVGSQVSRSDERECTAAVRRTNNQGNHARAVTTSGLEALDELLDLPYFDLKAELHVNSVARGARTFVALYEASDVGKFGPGNRAGRAYILLSLVLCLLVRHLDKKLDAVATSSVCCVESQSGESVVERQKRNLNVGPNKKRKKKRKALCEKRCCGLCQAGAHC